MDSFSYSVAFVDDHPAITDALASAFERRNWRVLYAEPNVRTAVQRMKVSIPDVLVTDLRIGNDDGIELIRLFLEQNPDQKVLVYSQHADAVTVCDVVEAGAMGYVVKDYKADVVVDAAAALVNGIPFFSSELVLMLVKSMGGKKHENKPLLTVQETKVLHMLVNERKEMKEIAVIMKVAYNTVAKYNQSLREKLQAKNALELEHRAFALGLFDLERHPNR
ncbi:response regulator transcription factor [Dyadobacter sp. CY261]|uniref:response regulator transcription factor n=1 Tax=Dyadobacter sp. CY261 TaxID=2907203 RepID=UPI001F23C78F|nr:response regulator transcription factor [Dyadobacter sp. CY261]MCF0074994.1 response regulator transcription factor [Dyadobacter sp. CY261]